MKHKWLLIVAIVLALCACLVLAACGGKNAGDTQKHYSLDLNGVYALAQEAGYTGTWEQLVEAVKGQDGLDGVSVTDATIDDEGNLILSLSSGRTVNLGNVRGPKGDQGEPGKDGKGIVSVTKTDSQDNVDIYTVTFSDGSTTTFTVTNGKDGVGNQGTSDNTNAAYLDYYPLDDGTLGVKAGKALYLSEIVIPATYNGKSISAVLDYAFHNASNLKQITIPEGVTTIGDRAFEGCRGLTSITIPDSVTSIGDYAFYGCSGLTSITIPDSVTSIGVYAFSGCSGLTYITIPDSVTSIGGNAFSGCSGLVAVYYEGTASSWDSIATSNGNTNLTDAARYYYSEIQPTQTGNWWHREDGVPVAWVTVGLEFALDGDAYTVTGYEGTATSIVIPSTYEGKPVVSIGYEAFWGFSSLISISIPEGVTSIGERAFWNCSGLTYITIPKSVTSILESSFVGCSGLKSITVAAGNTIYYSAGNCLIETAGKTLVRGCKNSVIPSDGSVTSIGSSAFAGCSELTSIAIPDSVTSIGGYAFSGCSGLTSISFAEGSLTTIGTYAFSVCSGLVSVTIPEGVTSIESHAFGGCSKLASISIPACVTSIGSNAFSYCAKLTYIGYQSTKAQWNAISKGATWDAGTGNYTVHCTNGDIAKK